MFFIAISQCARAIFWRQVKTYCVDARITLWIEHQRDRQLPYLQKRLTEMVCTVFSMKMVIFFKLSRFSFLFSLSSILAQAHRMKNAKTRFLKSELHAEEGPTVSHGCICLRNYTEPLQMQVLLAEQNSDLSFSSMFPFYAFFLCKSSLFQRQTKPIC